MGFDYATTRYTFLFDCLIVRKAVGTTDLASSDAER